MIIVAALALAAVAFIGNVLYLNKVKEAAYDDAQLVKVYVVKQPIPKGLAGEQAISQDYVRVGEMPQEYRPGSAVSNIDDIKNKVAINALSPGQVVVDGQFVDPNVAQVTFAQQVPAGQVAISISVDQVHGVAGLLLPGDKVNILVSTTDRNDEKRKIMNVMYQNVNILAIGTKTAPQAGAVAKEESETATQTTAADSGLITFSVPLEAAQRIALAHTGADGGSSIYLALVSPDNTPVDPRPAPVDSYSILNDLPVTPYPAA